MPDGSNYAITPQQGYHTSEREAREWVQAHQANPAITRGSGEQQASGSTWSHRQQAAARKLRALWHMSLPERALPMGYPSEVCQPRTPKGEDCRTDEQSGAAREAYSDYQWAMGELERCCGSSHAWAARQIAYGEALPLNRAMLGREAMGFLSDLWRIR